MLKFSVEMLRKYKALIAYMFFGVLTTIVNIVSYDMCYNYFKFSNTLSNVVAWILAVTAAYLTNKVWVFGSSSWKWSVLKKEIPAFISCRLATGVLDIAIMYISVDCMKYQPMVMKCISNILVILLNYVFSKLVIFKKK